MMRTISIGLCGLLLACTGRDERGASDDKHAVRTQMVAPSAALDEAAMGSAAAADMLEERTAERAERMRSAKMAVDMPRDGAPGAPPPEPKPDASGNTESESATRAWFPETFLFQPLVVTDSAGKATVAVRVPDRLTTWRVLGLAHGRGGAQGGATTSFLGTLPTYVDLVVPPFLVIGDEIRLPIQIVNTTEQPVATSLAIEVKHAELAGAGGPRTVPAQSSIVEYARLRATRAGTIQIRAALAGGDAVLRTIEVRPAGKPVTVTRSGTLAAPRTLKLAGPAGSDPATDRARLLVFPGALAVLRTELATSRQREGLAETAYALLLAGRAPSLLQVLGDTPDRAALRELAILAGQRAIRHARTLDLTSATLLAEAALAHPTDPVLTRLGERAAAFLAKDQRPDGTFGGGQGWTLQRVLVTTAEATRAVSAAGADDSARHRSKAVRAKAAGAFERNHAQVPDAYTAAAMLASGAVQGPLADTLRARVTSAIESSDDGAKYLEVPSGVVRPDGSVPTRAEATALAALALKGAADVPLADLGATLLGSYDPYSGWGDGRGNLACIQAVVELFTTPVPAGVKITLKMDGKPIAEGTLDREKLREVLALEAPAAGIAGEHTWEIVAEPAVAGLGYSLAVQGFVPWEKDTVRAGLELALPATVDATVGKPVELGVTAVAPSGIALHIEQSLPAGVQVDRPSLEALVAAGKLSRFVLADGKVEMFVPPLAPGQTFDVKYRAIPTLAGSLRSAASKIDDREHVFFVPPTRWIVR